MASLPTNGQLNVVMFRLSLLHAVETAGRSQNVDKSRSVNSFGLCAESTERGTKKARHISCRAFRDDC